MSGMIHGLTRNLSQQIGKLNNQAGQHKIVNNPATNSNALSPIVGSQSNPIGVAAQSSGAIPNPTPVNDIKPLPLGVPTVNNTNVSGALPMGAPLRMPPPGQNVQTMSDNFDYNMHNNPVGHASIPPQNSNGSLANNTTNIPVNGKPITPHNPLMDAMILRNGGTLPVSVGAPITRSITGPMIGKLAKGVPMQNNQVNSIRTLFQ